MRFVEVLLREGLAADRTVNSEEIVNELCRGGVKLFGGYFFRPPPPKARTTDMDTDTDTSTPASASSSNGLLQHTDTDSRRFESAASSSDGDGNLPMEDPEVQRRHWREKLRRLFANEIARRDDCARRCRHLWQRAWKASGDGEDLQEPEDDHAREEEEEEEADDNGERRRRRRVQPGKQRERACKNQAQEALLEWSPEHDLP